MKKIGIIIFIFALIAGVVIANLLSIETSFIKSPISFSFGKVQGSGNVITEKREVSNFKNVDVSGIFKVEIVAQKDFSLEIEADDNLLELITTEVDGETLKIERTKKFASNNSITLRISAPNIENLDVSGVSKTNLTNLNNESLTIDSSGASKIKVEGTTKRLVIDASGASKIDANNLTSTNVTVDGSGASNAYVNVSEKLNADLSGASNVSYTGNPAEINKKTSGASNIYQKD